MDRSPAALRRADVRQCSTLWAVELSADAVPWPEPAEAIIRAVTPTDIAPLRQAMAACQARDLSLAEARIHAGRLGYVAESRAEPGVVLSYGWVARHGETLRDLDFDFDAPPGFAWIYDCATVPQARGQGLYPDVLLGMRADLPRQGQALALIGTESLNLPSQQGIARAGFRKVADVHWGAPDGIVVYGDPDLPEPMLQMLGAAMASSMQAQVVTGGGIPWIEAVVRVPAAMPDSAGLASMRAAYGGQIHWKRPAMGEPATVTFHARGASREVAADASFETLAAALDALAPGLPWLGQP
jgi:hypothetical protein